MNQPLDEKAFPAEGVKELPGEKGNFGGDLVKLLRSNLTPNLWYTKAALGPADWRWCPPL